MALNFVNIKMRKYNIAHRLFDIFYYFSHDLCFIVLNYEKKI